MTLLTSGPWESVYNASDASEAYKTKLYAASNVYKPKGVNSFAMRPPFAVAEAAGTLGTTGQRMGQCIFEHIADDGTSYRFLFVGGRVWRWDGAFGYNDVTPAGVGFSATARIFAGSFSDNLIVNPISDKPFYVPSSGCSATPLVATTIQVDSVPSSWRAHGNFVVFDARLFFTLDNVAGTSLRDTIVWSEVANPAAGYQQSAAGYANFWELFQTDSHPIECLAATELSLVVFRRQSILNITGKTDQTFRTNATRESIEGVGSFTPAAIVEHNGTVWFLDEQGRQYRYTPGEKPEPLWEAMADTVAAEFQLGNGQTAGGFLGAASACYHSDLNVMLVLSYLPSTSVIAGNLLHVFDADSGLYYGTWDVDGGKAIHAIGCVRDANAHLSLCVLGESVAPAANSFTLATSGQFWRQYTLNEMNGAVLWKDPSGVPTTNIVTHQLGRNEEGEWHFDQCVLRGLDNNNNAIPLTYYTPRGNSTPPTAKLSLPPLLPIVNGIAGHTGEARAVWGLGPNAQGRWWMGKFSAPTTALTLPPFTPTAVELRGTLTKATSLAP